jgi:DNA ligase (NAD+)
LPDLYRLTKEQLLELDGFAEISAAKAIEAIEVSKSVPFSRVLLGLNIPKVGWVLAQSLARHFRNVDRLMEASQEEVEAVDGFGPDRAEIVVEWFEDDQNRALVQELRELGLRFEAGEEARPPEGPLTGHAYVITGTLEGYSREQAKAALEDLGAKVTDSVSKRTTGLIVGEEPGQSKLTKAQRSGVPLLSEADLEQLLRSQ